MTRQPNILFIFTDQQRADTMACCSGLVSAAASWGKCRADCRLHERGTSPAGSR